jgi:hypothetical protein
MAAVADKWAGLYFLFSKLFNHPNFEIQIADLSNVQICLNFAG